MLERMLLRFPARSRVPHVLLPAPRDRAAAAAVRLPLALPIRTYATPGRPKSVVGEPSRPVKRAVKKAAAKPADGTSAAEKKIAAKKRSPRALTPEEAEKRQAAAEKKAARDAARKQKASLRKASDKKKTKLEDLKTAALPDAPKKAQYSSAYQVYWSESAKATSGSEEKVTVKVKDAAAKWKEMSPADIEVRLLQADLRGIYVLTTSCSTTITFTVHLERFLKQSTSDGSSRIHQTRFDSPTWPASSYVVNFPRRSRSGSSCKTSVARSVLQLPT